VERVGVGKRVLVPDEVVQGESIELRQVAHGQLALRHAMPVDHETGQDLETGDSGVFRGP
jgi:hypothetical protein